MVTGLALSRELGFPRNQKSAVVGGTDRSGVGGGEVGRGDLSSRFLSLPPPFLSLPPLLAGSQLRGR